MIRKLSRYEYDYMWYIEYGTPYHYIPTPPEIGATIKQLIEDGLLIQLPNPTLEKSPLYTRFTKEGRVLFALHEMLLDGKHSQEVIDYDTLTNYNAVTYADMKHRIRDLLRLK